MCACLQVVAVEEGLGAPEQRVELPLDEPRLRCARFFVVREEGNKLLAGPGEPRRCGGGLLVREERGARGAGHGAGALDAEEDGVHPLELVGDGDEGGAVPWVVLPALLHLRVRGRRAPLCESVFRIGSEQARMRTCELPELGQRLNELFFRGRAEAALVSEGGCAQGDHEPAVPELCDDVAVVATAHLHDAHGKAIDVHLWLRAGRLGVKQLLLLCAVSWELVSLTAWLYGLPSNTSGAV